jgi:G:T-mismatch repair DNA endonuclease (very short patch repair protein)
MNDKKDKKQVTNKIEQAVSSMLTRLNLPFKEQVTVDKYTVDFLVGDKYIVECFGDFWHCNPQQYTSSYYNKGKKKTAEEIWQRDKERKEKFEQLGYKFLCVWESDIRKTPKIVKSKIKRYIKLDG